MAKSKRGGGKGTNSGGSRTSRASNVQGRGPGKSYRIVDADKAISEYAGRGFAIGGTTRNGVPSWTGYKDERFTPATEGRKYPGGTNRSRPTRTPRSATGEGGMSYALPDRPDGTGNRTNQQRLQDGTRVVYKGSQFWADAAAKKKARGGRGKAK